MSVCPLLIQFRCSALDAGQFRCSLIRASTHDPHFSWLKGAKYTFQPAAMAPAYLRERERGERERERER